MVSATRELPIAVRALHWLIIANFVSGLGYAAWMVFFVIRPEGVSGPLGDVAAWQQLDEQGRKHFAERILERFANAEATLVPPGPYDLAFDVHRCHFVELCEQLAKPELASLFCAADSAYFDDPAVPLEFHRPSTLAAGAGRCEFRFNLRSAPQGVGAKR